MVSHPNIVGICGAPCTGKTTLARRLVERLEALGHAAAYLEEPARLLAARGVKIDREMGEADYDNFLTAYKERDSTPAPLAIADRTPVDHFSYIAANRNLPRRLRERHRRAVHAAMGNYCLLLYLPVELELEDDSFRVTCPEYQRKLDAAIRRMLAAVRTPHVTVKGPVEERLNSALAAISGAWPGLLLQETGG